MCAWLFLEAFCAQLDRTGQQHAPIVAAKLRAEGCPGCAWLQLGKLQQCSVPHFWPSAALVAFITSTCSQSTLMCAAAEAFQKRQKTTVQAPAAAGIPAAVSLSCCLCAAVLSTCAAVLRVLHLFASVKRMLQLW